MSLVRSYIAQWITNSIPVAEALTPTGPASIPAVTHRKDTAIPATSALMSPESLGR